jgi:pyruvate-formate lyase
MKRLKLYIDTSVLNFLLITEDIEKTEITRELFDLIDKKEPSVLDLYNQISVRVGGFQAPFVTLPEEQQENYLKRSILGRV